MIDWLSSTESTLALFAYHKLLSSVGLRSCASMGSQILVALAVAVCNQKSTIDRELVALQMVGRESRYFLHFTRSIGTRHFVDWISYLHSAQSLELNWFMPDHLFLGCWCFQISFMLVEFNNDFVSLGSQFDHYLDFIESFHSLTY